MNIEGKIMNQSAKHEGETYFGAGESIAFRDERHIAHFWYSNHIEIGCEHYTISHWLENYKEIGRINGYNESQIESYGNFIKRCAKKQKEQA